MNGWVIVCFRYLGLVEKVVGWRIRGGSFLGIE
jgi:hypothetical protein